MNALTVAKDCPKYDPTDPANGQKQIYVQLVLSVALGASAFLAFCFLRPRWKSLYQARKRLKDAAQDLPELPDGFLDWVPVLYRVTEQQVLSSAGLDAYVFLAFFKMSIRLFAVMFVVASLILAPINMHFDYLATPSHPQGPDGASLYSQMVHKTGIWEDAPVDVLGTGGKKKLDTSYLWAYLAFTYFFTFLALYFMSTETRRIIKIRQDYLGSQSTVTDRTIKLSGIPPELRKESDIKDFLEKLEIGKVENVTICRFWKDLDRLMDERAYLLRKLEEAWTVHMGRRKTKTLRPSEQPHIGVGRDGEEENRREDEALMGPRQVTAYENPRPTTRLWYGFLNLQSRKIDAIDYYEEKLRRMDEKIAMARKKSYKPTPVAFVTMDSIPACQMAVQALLDPSPMQLLAKLAPAPTDIVWQNTYLPRYSRMWRAWTITVFIVVLTVFWLIPVVALAGLIDLCSIRQVWPGLANLLEEHEIVKALVQTGLPTLVVSLLNIAVPFLYDYLANMQGMVSQGDVELSVISKNFFFTFFNVFLVFTAFGSAAKFLPELQDSLKDTTKLAYKLASSVQTLAVFYTNFILLQGVGLLPFRLLEFGSVTLYPIMLMGSKTPRDYAELVQPPLFKYGFYLPSALLVYVLCIVYSILPAGYMVLFFGLIYFIFGYYTYKYQLLYAMDHPQHATGGAWPMICYRILLGLGVFQLVMAGIIALKTAFTAAGLVLPLIPFTIWYSYYFARTYEPLMKFIALRSIRRESNADVNLAGEDLGIHRPPGYDRRPSTTLDEAREAGLRFINPNLTAPLEKPWIIQDGDEVAPQNGEVPPATDMIREDSNTSTHSLGISKLLFHIHRLSTVAMSSHILLSRGVAGPSEADASQGRPVSPTVVTSIFESGTRHIMTLGDAASHHISAFDGVGTTDKGKGKEAPDTAETASSRSTTHPPSQTTTESQPIPKRALSRSGTFFDDPTDPRAILDDHLLEPCPGSRVRCSVSEVLHGGPHATPVEEGIHASLRRSFTLHGTPSRPAHAPTEAFGECRPLFPAPTFPPNMSPRACPDVGLLESVARKSDVGARQGPVPGPVEVRWNPAANLPTEVIQLILYDLGPVDFNSARHACRSWFVSSLNRTLLIEMLKRAGYSDGIEPNVHNGAETFSDEWWMSKRIARECALGPEPRLSPSGTAFCQVASVDFTEIEAHYPGPDLASTLFTVSSCCGRFLMAANGCLVYVYELNRSHKDCDDGATYPGLLRPVTSIICPRRVLACSMDTSSQRYAIALLLDGRMGLVCDIRVLSPDSAVGLDDGMQPTSSHRMPVEDGPRSLYRNLCSEDDPPRSVAICPQRRCVAFGCSSGLELHWIDALTGHDLSRWFPLTAPSDYLFFLPPRRSVDSAKKLRLISSAGRPNERSSLSQRTFGGSPRASPFWERFGWGLSQFEEDNGLYGGSSPSGARGILTRLRIDASRSSLIGRMDCSDHYRAVPLSDGYHILFTDPATGLLCLGSDAPVGGPTKLLRKIWFHGPSLDGTVSTTPVAYTAGSDLSQGVRVVAAFDSGSGEQSLWLFSVPRDIFASSQAKPASSTTAAWLHSSSSREAELMEQEWINWWPHDGLQQWLNSSPDPTPRVPPRNVWPVKIQGQRIGSCKGLVDLALDAGRHMVVWALTRAGHATVWKMASGMSGTTSPAQKVVVVRDGTVRAIDGAGDTEMTDVDAAAAAAASYPSSRLGVPVRTTPGSYDGTSASRDWEGDIVMTAARPGAAQEETLEAVLVLADGDEAPGGREVRYQTETWSRTSYLRARAGFVEEVRGIARIDLELRG